MAISPPDTEDSAARLVDWLELSCLFSPTGIFRLDEIKNIFAIEEDYDQEDLAEKDAAIEDISTVVASEMQKRKDALDIAYPFEISANGEEARYLRIAGLGSAAYLLSLVIEHSWSDGLMSEPHKVTSQEFISVRQAFEILAAMAAAGYARGPSFHIGRNRGGAENLLNHLRAAWNVIGDGTIRQVPPPDAPLAANDDGIDAIAFGPSNDGPPHREIVFAQSASGQDWKSKSVKTEMDKFLRNWFEVYPVTPKTPIMVIAALPVQPETMQQTQRLGYLAHRLRAPMLIHLAHNSFLLDARTLDCGDEIILASNWLRAYLSGRSVPYDAP